MEAGAGAWAAEFAAAVDAGHASRTMELTRALTVRSDGGSGGDDAGAMVGLEELRGRLAGEARPVARNRMVREWLSAHREAVLTHWAALGLPAPPPQASPAAAGGAGVAGARTRGLVVFDFDLTLAAKNVGIFDLEDCEDRCFGGAARVAMLRSMLEQLAAAGVEMAVLTFNSSHTVRKSLGPPPGCNLLALLRGAKTNAQTVVGCEDEECEGAHGYKKSAAIARRWLGSLPPERVLFVDDDRKNIEDVERGCPGVATRRVADPRGGMGAEDCEAVLEWLARLPPAQ